jgi:hypothetical protein
VKRNLEIEMAKPDGDLLSWLSVRGILEQKQRKLESVSVSLSNWCLEHAKILYGDLSAGYIYRPMHCLMQ